MYIFQHEQNVKFFLNSKSFSISNQKMQLLWVGGNYLHQYKIFENSLVEHHDNYCPYYDIDLMHFEMLMELNMYQQIQTISLLQYKEAS